MAYATGVAALNLFGMWFSGAKKNSFESLRALNPEGVRVCQVRRDGCAPHLPPWRYEGGIEASEGLGLPIDRCRSHPLIFSWQNDLAACVAAIYSCVKTSSRQVEDVRWFGGTNGFDGLGLS